MPSPTARDLYAISDIAETTAARFGGDDERTKLLNRQVRNLVTQQLVSVTERRGGRGDAYMNDREAAKANLFLALVDMGFDAKMLREVAPALDGASDPNLVGAPLVLDGCCPPRAIDLLLLDARKPEAPEWSLEIVVRREISTGQRRVVAWLQRADQRPWPEDDPRSLKGAAADRVEALEFVTLDTGSTAWVRVEPKETIGRISLPATRLVAHLVSEG